VGDVDLFISQQLVKKLKALIKRNIRARVLSRTGFEEMRETTEQKRLLLSGKPLRSRPGRGLTLNVL
jgi:hypothetical protein